MIWYFFLGNSDLYSLNSVETIEVFYNLRIDIEKLTGTKVMLDLFVKVRKDWKDDALALADLGFSKKDI